MRELATLVVTLTQLAASGRVEVPELGKRVLSISPTCWSSVVMTLLALDASGVAEVMPPSFSLPDLSLELANPKRLRET